jgi:hypothetical protein
MQGKRKGGRYANSKVEFLVDARCGLDDPEFMEDTVVRAVMRVMG